jgi:hypothetical protein
MFRIPVNVIPESIFKIQKEIKTESATSGVLEGGRNQFLFKHGLVLLDKGLSFNEILALLMDKNKNECKPNLHSDEVYKIAESVFRYKKEKKEIEVLTLKELYDDSRFTEPVPVIEGLINKSEFHLCSATAKTGKTLLQLNCALAVARGEKFLEHFDCRKGKVLIIQTEIGNNQLRKRVISIFGDENEDLGVFFVNERIKVDTKEGLQSLEDLIKEINHVLVILDPFYTLHNKNEDSSTEIAPILSDLRELVLKLDIALLMIHHQGKKREFGAQTGHKHRGSSSFADVPDGSWSLQKSSSSEFLTLSLEMRNIEAPGPFQLNLDKDSLRFKVMQVLKQHDGGISVKDIIEYVSENPGKGATELKDALSLMYEISARSVGTRLGEALKMKKIFRKRDGRSLKYFLTTEEEVGTSNKGVPTFQGF